MNRLSLALFDLDHTLLQGDCDQLWGDFLSAKCIVDGSSYQSRKNRYYQDYLQGRLNMTEFLAFSAETLATLTATQLEQLGQEFAEHWLRPKVRPKALQCISSHQQRGDTVMVITASNDFLANLAADLLNIEQVIASNLERVHGRFSGKSVGIPSYREGKMLRLQQWLQDQPYDLLDSTFYSDSHNDLPLMLSVSFPVAVNPDAQLRQHCIDNNWTILDWSFNDTAHP